MGGHRGNPAEHPENTLASFRSAIEMGLAVIECDVHRTADGRLAVIHDPTLDRTTNGRGPVAALTMAQLRDLDAGGGERIPTLEEVLDLARDRVGLAIEVKGPEELDPNQRYQGIEELLVAAVGAARMTQDVAVISFNHDIVHRVKQLEPGIVGGLLVVQQPMLLRAMLRDSPAEIYSPHWSTVDEATVAIAHELGKVVGVWTVDDERALAQCRAAGVDAVYSNRPRDIMGLL
ncbi:MAG: glycerophosphodiester phosphodiesterase [Candidatus Dormibacteria bacterium]